MAKRSREAWSPPVESETAEWKQSLSEWKEIVESCAAFASANGGTVYIGVRPKGAIAGVAIGKGSLEDLANKIVQNTEPRLVPSIEIKTVDEQTVVQVDVGPSAAKPVFAFGRALRRSGRTNQRLHPEDIARLYMDSRGITWDETTLRGLELSDVNSKLVRRFLSIARQERRWEVGERTPVRNVLEQLGLLQEDKLTVAGNLLFGKHPQRRMVQAKVRCARFKGDDTVTFIDMKAIDGCLMDQIEDAMDFVRRNIRMGVEIKGGKTQRTETWEYPLDAVREAVTNAVCHRDYASSCNIQVHIFDSSLEVWNPGGLPPEISVADLRRTHNSYPRNKLIANAFFLTKHIEQFGTGTRRMINECVDSGLPEPEFQNPTGAFQVVFRRSAVPAANSALAQLSERELKAVEYAREHGQIARQEYERLVGVSRNTASRDLADLQEKGILRRSGRSRSAVYVPAESAQ